MGEGSNADGVRGQPGTHASTEKQGPADLHRARKTRQLRGLDGCGDFVILTDSRCTYQGVGVRVPGFQTYEVRLVTNTG